MYFPSGLGTGLYALSVLRRVSVYSCDLTSEALIRAAKNRATKTRATLEWRLSTVSASLDASTALELLQCDNGQSLTPNQPEKFVIAPGHSRNPYSDFCSGASPSNSFNFLPLALQKWAIAGVFFGDFRCGDPSSNPSTRMSSSMAFMRTFGLTLSSRIILRRPTRMVSCVLVVIV